MARVRAVHDLVERLLAPDGPLPALCAEQRSLARIPSQERTPTRRALSDLGAFATFAEAEDHGVFVPAGCTADALCVTARSRAVAAAAFVAAKRAAAAADVVLTNHALVLAGCRLGGRVLGAAGDPDPARAQRVPGRFGARNRPCSSARDTVLWVSPTAWAAARSERPRSSNAWTSTSVSPLSL